MRLVMRVGLRDLRCKWLRDVTVPKIFLLRHLSVLTDPLSEAVYWQGLMINPAKTESRATVSQQRASRFQLALFPIHLSRSLSKTTLHTHTVPPSESTALQRAVELHLAPGNRGEKMNLVLHDSPSTHMRARVSKCTETRGRKNEGKGQHFIWSCPWWICFL